VGVVLNVVAAVSGMSMREVTRGVWPFLISQTLALLLVQFPELVMVPLRWLRP
jgi:TRAP-type C4-dicarboxylate transport system permease large subunit